ncbi:MAG: CNP1-like family protein [Burkholderiaceae bacterium]|nr:CNP1-like family protein [Burkholderiaceae bacterium]
MATAAAALACTALLAGAPALALDDDPDAPKWQEDEAPPPPAYSLDGLIDIELPRARSRSVKIGIAPQTIAVNPKTGVVRYVVVARGPSAVNASYEGIRCATAEYRVYARQVAGQPWEAVRGSTWQPMAGPSSAPYPYALALGGVCAGTSVNAPADAIIRALRSQIGFNRES